MHMPFTGERYVPEIRGQIYYEHVHRYALAFGLASGLDVLDIASGEGYGAAYLALAARSVIGVDIDEESVRHAAARYTAMNLSFLVGSCTRIPLADASVDLVVSFETIEHIEEHEQFMREVVRVLRPDGRLLISSPNKLVYSDHGHFHNPFHARELYFDQFRDLLQHWFPHCRLYGQRIIAASAIHPLRGVASTVRCIGPTTHAEDRGLPALPAPAYFIGLCRRTASARDGELLDSVFVDPRDDLLDDIMHPGALPGELDGAHDRSFEVERADEPRRVVELAPPLAPSLEPAEAEAEADVETVAPDEALRSEVVRLTALVERLEAERARDAAAFRTAAEAAERRVAQVEDEASALDREARAAAARAEAAERACRSLELRLAQAEGALRAAAAAGAADHALAERLDGDLARCRAEHAEAQAQLGAVLGSTSWRLTRPVRAALRRLRGG